MTAVTDATIRPAGPADAATLTELLKRTFRETYAADTRPEDMDAFLTSAYSEDQIRSGIEQPGHRWFVAEVDGAAVGLAELRADEQHPAVVGQHAALLAHLYLDQRYQGIGLGARLMQHCIDVARAAGHDALWLGVWERNSRAIRFYERWGFVPVGEVPFTFGSEQQRDIVMARAI